jgi:glucose-6-phosphate isomerase
MARTWLLNNLPEEAVQTNFAAVSMNDPALDEFGIAKDLRFRIWDWVGGRYSIWSAIGLAAALTTGGESFRRMLAGAEKMDQHFRTTELGKNIPVISGLLNIWNRNFLGLDQQVVLPYDQRLELLPAYLQQLVMESLGKSVRQDGAAVEYATGASLWGGEGSNAQHSIAQWLHQGSAAAYVDYIGTVNGPEAMSGGGHTLALANMIAQADARAGLNATDGELVSHKVLSGNRPSSILLLKDLSPESLGMLLAFYEHQVFVQAVIWGVNPFDQWGVELGKVRASKYSEYLQGKDSDQLPGIGSQILKWSEKS